MMGPRQKSLRNATLAAAIVNLFVAVLGLAPHTVTSFFAVVIITVSVVGLTGGWRWLDGDG